MMTYKEFRDWGYQQLSWWSKTAYRMRSFPPDWRPHYYKWVLKSILKSKSLEEAKEKANIALER